jgi:hypothetical protein
MKMNMETIWQIIQWIVGIYGFLISILIPIYFIPNSPIRRLVETWIEHRVSHRFNKELETHRYRLAIEAENIRAEHERLLYNATLVTERRHEVYRELFKLIHLANGEICSLFGMRSSPIYDDYNKSDLTKYMDVLRFPGKTKDSILEAWDTDRPWAKKELSIVVRRIDIEKANESYRNAWNYFLLNSLYLNDYLNEATKNIFDPLLTIILRAEYPDMNAKPGTHELIKNANNLLDKLRIDLRKDLRITNENITEQSI